MQDFDFNGGGERGELALIIFGLSNLGSDFQHSRHLSKPSSVYGNPNISKVVLDEVHPSALGAAR